MGNFHAVVYNKLVTQALFYLSYDQYYEAYRMLYSYALYLGLNIQKLNPKVSPLAVKEECYNLLDLIHLKLKDIISIDNTSNDVRRVSSRDLGLDDSEVIAI